MLSGPKVAGRFDLFHRPQKAWHPAVMIHVLSGPRNPGGTIDRHGQAPNAWHPATWTVNRNQCMNLWEVFLAHLVMGLATLFAAGLGALMVYLGRKSRARYTD